MLDNGDDVGGARNGGVPHVTAPPRNLSVRSLKFHSSSVSISEGSMSSFNSCWSYLQVIQEIFTGGPRSTSRLHKSCYIHHIHTGPGNTSRLHRVAMYIIYMEGLEIYPGALWAGDYIQHYTYTPRKSILVSGNHILAIPPSNYILAQMARK